MTIEELMSNYKESHTAVRKHNKNKAEGTVLTIKKQRKEFRMTFICNLLFIK